MKRYGRNQKRRHRQLVAELEAEIARLRGPWRRANGEVSLESLGFIQCQETLEEETGCYSLTREVRVTGWMDKPMETLYEVANSYRVVSWKGVCYMLYRAEVVDRDAQPLLSLHLKAVV